MASFSVDEFVGNGALFELQDQLVARGWDDVPTLKLLSAADLDDLQLTQRQKVSGALLCCVLPGPGSA